MAMAKSRAAGTFRNRLLRDILINGTLGLLCLLWLIPLLGLLISSFRTRSDIVSSGHRPPRPARLAWRCRMK